MERHTFNISKLLVQSMASGGRVEDIFEVFDEFFLWTVLYDMLSIFLAKGSISHSSLLTKLFEEIH